MKRISPFIPTLFMIYVYAAGVYTYAGDVIFPSFGAIAVLVIGAVLIVFLAWLAAKSRVS